MYNIHYKVPTASGKFREKSISIGGYEPMKEQVERIVKAGYEIVINPMCGRCSRYLTDCPGEINHVYTGCVNKR